MSDRINTLILEVRYGVRWYPCPAWVAAFDVRGDRLTLRCDGPAMRRAGKYQSAARARYRVDGRVFQATTIAEGAGYVTISAWEIRERR